MRGVLSAGQSTEHLSIDLSVKEDSPMPCTVITRTFAACAALLLGALAGLPAAERQTERTISLSLQTRSEDGTPRSCASPGARRKPPSSSCDMWDLHHCHNAVKREAEMAQRMNEVIEKARAQGVFIIHAPSSCMKAYEGHPARERAKTTPRAASLPDKIDEWCKQIPAEQKAVYPIDQSDGGEDDDPPTTRHGRSNLRRRA